MAYGEIALSENDKEALSREMGLAMMLGHHT